MTAAAQRTSLGVGQVQANVSTGIQSGLPTTPGLWWWNYAWIYVPGTGFPPDPVSGNVLPPQPNYTGGPNIGDWVEQNGFWLWFPPGAQGTPYGQVQGGDGNLYDIYAQSGYAAQDAAASATASSYTPPPSFTPSPFDTSPPIGQWINPYLDYWVWSSSLPDVVGADLGTTSTGGIIALLVVGVLVISGVTFLIYEGTTP